jgi:hypothetical protein
MRLAVPVLCASGLAVLGCMADVEESAPPIPAGEIEQAWLFDPDFEVDFEACREVANVGLLPTANARPLVPEEFTLVGENDELTPFVVRTVHCDSIAVDGKLPKPGNIVQIGVLILAPEGDGDINNYTLYFDTSNLRLALRLALAGVNASWVPTLQESLDEEPDGSGDYEFAVPPPFQPRMAFAGPVGAPVGGPIPFVANWWRHSFGDTVKMSSTFPELFIADNDVVLTVPPGSQLAQLIGATEVSDWPVLKLFDTFPSAHMVVTRGD